MYLLTATKSNGQEARDLCRTKDGGLTWWSLTRADRCEPEVLPLCLPLSGFPAGPAGDHVTGRATLFISTYYSGITGSPGNTRRRNAADGLQGKEALLHEMQLKDGPDMPGLPRLSFGPFRYREERGYRSEAQREQRENMERRLHPA